MAVYDALRKVRSDISIFTNRDAIRVNPRLRDTLIPVEWREEFRDLTKTRETLLLSSKAFQEQRAIVIFPSGRIAYWQNGGLNERPWLPSFVALARKHKVPVLPVHVRSRNSGLFYWFANWNTELRDMTVFHELLNKKGKTLQIHFGPMIPNEHLTGDAESLTAPAAASLRTRPGGGFRPNLPIRFAGSILTQKRVGSGCIQSDPTRFVIRAPLRRPRSVCPARLPSS